MYLLLLVLAALLFATGGFFMKLSIGLTRLTPSILIFVFFCAGATCQTIAMKKANMGVAYIFVLGLEALAAFAISAFVLHERPTAARFVAVALIVSGIVLLERT